MMTKYKNVTLTMDKRLEVLNKINKDEAMKKIATEFYVGISTVSDWKKNGKKILNSVLK